MRNVNQNFKLDIKEYGRQLDAIITYGNTRIEREDLNSINPCLEGSLFKTAMHYFEIDSNVAIPKDTMINIQIGVKFNRASYSYVEFNQYKVVSCEIQEDTESYRILAYDKIVDSMIDFDLEIQERLTVRNYLIRIFNRLGWSTNNIPASFINSGKYIEPGIHWNIGYSFRDVLDEISTITGASICAIDGVPTIKYITETNEVVNEEYICSENATIKDRFFINSLVFSRAEESDNIYRKDDESIEEYGLHEFRIADNQILSTNDRADFIDDLYNYLRTIEFYTYEVKTTGLLWLEIADKFTFSMRGNTYSVILLGDEATIDQDIDETLFADAPEETETDYKYADSTDKKVNQTYMLIDKQNQKIQTMASQIGDRSQKQTSLTQDVDGVSSLVGSTIDYTREAEGYTQIHLENCGKKDILKLEINGNATYESNLFPRTNLYPRTGLQPNQKGG